MDRAQKQLKITSIAYRLSSLPSLDYIYNGHGQRIDYCSVQSELIKDEMERNFD